MARPLDTGVQAASIASQVTLVAAVKLQFQTGTVFANTSPYSLVIAGDTYLGVGQFGSVTDVQESVEVRSFQTSLKLSGVDPADIGLALGAGYKNQPGTIYAVFLNNLTHQIIGTPPIIFKGLMDVMAITFGADGSAGVELSLSNRLANWDVARIRRYTDEDQQAAFPGDLGCSLVAAMQDKEVIWGMKV